MNPFISPEQIAEMKACGYNVETADEAAEALKIRAAQLCRKIEDVFAGVTLGKGTGLSEGNAIDDCEDAETRAECRLSDEKDDWQRITSDELNRYYCSPSYFDAEGMRFHLPAFLICDLRGEYNHGVASQLDPSSDYRCEQLSLLNEAQREVVREYLNFMLIHPSYEYERCDVADGLLGYWGEKPTQDSPPTS